MLSSRVEGLEVQLHIFLTMALERISCQRHASAALFLEKEPLELIV